MCDMEAACTQSWFIPAGSAFGAALAHVGVHVCPRIHSVQGVHLWVNSNGTNFWCQAYCSQLE